MASKLTKKINSRFNPTLLSGYPVYAAGGAIDPYSMMLQQGQQILSSAGTGMDNYFTNKRPEKANLGSAFFSNYLSGGMGIPGAIKGIGALINRKGEFEAQQDFQNQQQQEGIKRDLISNLPAQHYYQPTFAMGGKMYQDGGRSIPNRNAPSNDTYDRIKPLLMVTKNIKPAWGDNIGDFLYDMKSDRYRSTSPDSYGIENALDEQDRLKNLKGDIKINDIRKVAPNRKMSHNVNSETVRKLVKGSLKKGINPNTVLAIALQETGIANINPLHQNYIDNIWRNEGYTPQTIKDADLINKNLDFLNNRLSAAKKIGKTNEADIIQVWNGYGKMPPGYYGRKDTIDMAKDPVYGNRVIALRDSAILTTPEIQNIIKEEQLNFKYGGKISPSEIAKGTKEEMEHTSSKKVSRKTAMDHLREDPKYYTKLKKAGLADSYAGGGMLNSYANGGNLDNTTVFQGGGSHQENQLGGIPQGTNALVEEGEVRFKDYIFSNRIPYTKKK